MEHEEEILARITNSWDLDQAVEALSRAMTTAFEESCPLKTRKEHNDIPWWNGDLDRMRKKVRRLSYHRNDIGRKEEYKKALTD